MRPGGETVSRPVVGRFGLTLPVSRHHRRYLAGVLALAGAYYAAAKLGSELEFSGPVAAIIWVPAGVGIAFLSLGGLRFWPGVLVGDLLANDYSLLPPGSVLGQTFGNMAEVLVAALVIRRLIARGSPLDSLGGIARLLATIAAATAISAIVGPLSLWAGGVVSSGKLLEVARTWWLGDAAGALIVIPLALAWYQPPPRGWARGRAVEAALMLAAVAGMSEIAFRSESPLAYLVFPALGWAALRFDRRGATLAIAVAVGFAVWKTTHYHGPFVYDSITLSVLTTQLYIAVAALSTLCLAALVSERERFAEGLDASRVRLVKASDTERRRLEHNLHDGAQQRLSSLSVRLGIAADRAREARDSGAVALDDAGKEVVRAIDELPSTRFDETVEATLYYVFTEALTNAQKHAHASSIRVRASATSHAVHLEMADDGIGGATERAGGGLAGLRDRVEALGGTFDLDSPSGHGTRIAAAIPQRQPGP